LTLVPLFRRVAAAPDPAYRVLSQAYTSQTRQAPRHRAMTAGTEPILCRVAAAPDPAYRILSQANTSQTRQAPRRWESIDYLPDNPVAW
ncbi:TPA: hypothetical protein ACJEWJ_005802, partial [Klebsiella quasipneumoniae]